MTRSPLVTCVMPTRNRRRLAEQAIWYFLRQDYPHRELVIVDDGDDPVHAPTDERIRCVRLEQRTPLGQKLNIGCRSARGELIAHWDDDAWAGADRLSVQVSALGSLDVCGAEQVLYYRLRAGQAWLRRFGGGESPGLAGGTLLYRRSVWAKQPFPDVDPGSAELSPRAPVHRVKVMREAPFYFGLLADGESAVDLDRPEWERGSMTELAERVGLDADFYASLRNGDAGRPSVPSRRPGVGPITLAASFMLYDGYGSLGEYLALGLQRTGADVHVEPLMLDADGLSDEFRALLGRSQPQPDAPTLFYCSPQGQLERYRTRSELFVNTMWETSRLPAAWVPLLETARTVIVPTRFVARVFRSSGVTAPIEVVPEGIDPDVYRFEPRPERPGLTTLAIGTLAPRKNMDVAIAAWKQAFAGDPEARLVIKARFGYTHLDDVDERIRLVDSNETTRGIAHWYREADVLLALGSEGFGLPLVEGMATGLPVIALDAAGQADVCREAEGLILPVEPKRTRTFDELPFGPCGHFLAPDVEDVAARLRWVADHRDEAAELGRAAAAWAPKARSIWDKGPAVLEVMERRARPPRTLRRVPTVWVPSWGTRCGVAEEVARLLPELPGSRPTATRPELAAARVLHVHYEPGISAEAELTACLDEAAAARVPTVVTEHAVVAQAHAWERRATVLAATTEQGVEALRARYPGQRVEHLPLGCPTWFRPPAARKPGRVIGAFGFLERQKGFWALLDLLREVPRTRLLLFSHARDPELGREFAQAARGLPVEWVDEFLPAEEIARRLAAEADLLAYWYDETPYPAASGAARIGLATGVPVLTSPTRWFADLRDVTHQPASLAEGAAALLEDAPLRRRLAEDARAFCHDHSYARMARRHRELWQSLEQT